MIRSVLFLISVLVIAWGFAWLADRPGEIAITWMGYRVETSVIVAAFAVAALVLAVMAVWAIVRAILRSPEQLSLFFRHRRAIKGYLAISRGLIAVGAGDLRLARRSADDAARLSPGDPLALLLTAQSAQMAGDSITVSLNTGTLIVRGERPLPRELQHARILRMEIPYGNFERRIELPPIPFEISGRHLADGCLMLRLRKGAR